LAVHHCQRRQTFGSASELTREVLAKYIIEQARQGELDERRLRDGAPPSLVSVKSETFDQLAPVIDANFLEYPAPMDREMLNRHLAEAEEHIETGDKNIARQRTSLPTGT